MATAITAANAGYFDLIRHSLQIKAALLRFLQRNYYCQAAKLVKA